MDRPENLSNNELIQLFLDGELNDMERKQLFNALAYDEELQQNFSESLLLRDSLHLHSSMVPPPPLEASRNLFLNAGFDASPFATAPSGIMAGLAGVARRWYGYGIAASVGMIATLLVVETSRDGGEQAMRNSAGAQAHATPLQAPRPQMQTPSQAAPQGAQPGEMRVKRPEIVYNSSSEPYTLSDTHRRSRAARIHDERSTLASTLRPSDERNTDSPAATAEQSPVYGAELTIANAMESHYAINPNLGSGLGSVERQAGSVAFPVYDRRGTAEAGDIRLQVRGLQTLSVSPSKNTETNGRSQDNMAMSLLYQLDTHNALGIELGREAFPLYMQDRQPAYAWTPTLTWAGALYRYNTGSIGTLAPARLYGQTFAGATVLGPYVRAGVGVECEPMNGFIMSLGVDAGSLIYEDRSSWKSVEKVNLTYGLHWRF